MSDKVATSRIAIAAVLRHLLKTLQAKKLLSPQEIDAIMFSSYEDFIDEPENEDVQRLVTILWAELQADRE